MSPGHAWNLAVVMGCADIVNSHYMTVPVAAAHNYMGPRYHGTLFADAEYVTNGMEGCSPNPSEVIKRAAQRGFWLWMSWGCRGFVLWPRTFFAAGEESYYGNFHDGHRRRTNRVLAGVLRYRRDFDRRSALCRRHPAWRPTPLTALSVEAGVEYDSMPASILPLSGGCWRAVFDSPADSHKHAGHFLTLANGLPTRLISAIRLRGRRIARRDRCALRLEPTALCWMLRRRLGGSRGVFVRRGQLLFQLCDSS